MQKVLMLTAVLAQIAHETNRAYCQSIGDNSQPAWDAAPDWQKESAMKGIEGALAGNTPEQQHQSWYDHKAAEGWVYGEVKNPDAKTHPCMVPYADLPEDQQRKDYLYSAVVKAAHGALIGEINPALPEIKPEPRPQPALQRPTIGRQVHYVLADGQHRAATVVNAWPQSYQSQLCNLTVHLDGMNDFNTGGFTVNTKLIPPGSVAGHGVLHVGSASQDEGEKKPGTWHWPERE